MAPTTPFPTSPPNLTTRSEAANSQPNQTKPWPILGALLGLGLLLIVFALLYMYWAYKTNRTSRPWTWYRPQLSRRRRDRKLKDTILRIGPTNVPDEERFRLPIINHGVATARSAPEERRGKWGRSGELPEPIRPRMDNEREVHVPAPAFFFGNPKVEAVRTSIANSASSGTLRSQYGYVDEDGRPGLSSMIPEESDVADLARRVVETRVVPRTVSEGHAGRLPERTLCLH